MERNAAEAARDEDWKEVRRLVEQGKNVNAVDRGDRRTALHYAVIWGNPKICSFLMSRGAKVNLKDKDGNQPLHAAARGENSDTRQQIRKLNENSVWRYTQLGSLITRVDASYSLSQCGITADFDSYRPWHKATRNSSYIRTVQLLVDCGADTNALNALGQTPLHAAAGGEEDSPKLCSILLKHKAKIDAVDKDGNQPLHLACKQRNFLTGNLLLTHRADVNFLNKQQRSPLDLANESILISSFIIDGDHALHIAIRGGAIQAVKLLVGCGADVNELNEKGQTPLHTAAGGLRHCRELCSILIEHKAKIDAVDKDGNQPLHLACKQRNFLTGNLLLTHKADVNFLNKQQRSPLDLANESILKSSRIIDGDHALHIAVRIGDIQTVKLLVGCGADVNELNEKGQTPLHTVASFIVEHKAKIDAVDKYGNQPLHLACEQDHIKRSLPVLFNRPNANLLNADGLTLLHTAAVGLKGSHELCSILIEYKAKIDAVDKDGNQPLHLACKQRNFSTGNLLLTHGADVNFLNKQQRSPLDLANESILKSSRISDGDHALHIAVRNGDIQAVKLLVGCGANVNELNEEGQTPLHTATSILVEHKAKIDAVDKDGNQPLHLACEQDHIETSLLLLSKGANANSLNDDGQTPLHTAAGGLKDCHELCSILIEHKGKIDAVDKDGNQPLHLACKQSNFLTGNLLLIHGADVNFLNKQQRSPLDLANESILKSSPISDGNHALHVAARKGDVQAVKLLVCCGADVNELNEKGQTPLHTAAGGLKDCRELCSILIEHKAKIDAVDKDGNQPLHLACERGRIQTSLLLLSKGANANSLNADGQTPLHTAAGGLKDFCELCSILVKHKAKIDAVDKDGNQPLHLACERGCIQTSLLLLSKGANANSLNADGQTPLHTAAGGLKDFCELCSILVKHKAKIDAVDKDGNQPLHLACERGCIQTSLLLLSKGANANSLNADGQTPLHTAAGGLKDFCELCSILVKHKAKIDAVDKDGNQPLHLACERGCIQTSLLLLSKGANANSLNADGQTPLHTAAGALKDFPKLCSILLNRDAKIDAVDKDGNQPLHLACERVCVRTSLLLLSKGANANSLNADGQTPLHMAAGALKDFPKLCSILLNRDAKIDAVDKDGNQPLHLACKQGHIETSLLLLSRGANSNSLNADGQTPLHMAAGALKDFPKLCSILLNCDAKIDAVDKDGNQPLHLACKQGHIETSLLLLSRGANSNSLNVDGQTPLHTAAGGLEDCLELCSILVEDEAKIDAVDKDGNQPLHLACESGLMETVEHLLDCNADVFATNNFHQTALHKAARSNRDCPTISVMLIAKGAHVNATDGNGDTSLQVAYQKGNRKTVEVLIENDPDRKILNVRNRDVYMVLQTDGYCV